MSGRKQLSTGLKSALSPAEFQKAVDKAHGVTQPFGFKVATTVAHRVEISKSALKSPAVKLLLGELERLVPFMDAEGASNTALGLAKMGALPTYPLWHALIQRSRQLKSCEFKAQAISNLMWGLATASVSPGKALMKAMSTEAVLKAKDFKPHEISNLMSALSNLNVSPDGTLMKAMSAEAVTKAKDFNSEDISKLMWALANLDLSPDAKLAKAMSSEALLKSKDFKPQEITNLMSALANFDVSPNTALVEALSAEAVSKAGEFNPQEVSHMMYALARLDPILLRHRAQRC
jgi:hypothetical protein